MSDAISRPIMLRAPIVTSIRSGARTHIVMPAVFVPGRRMAVGQEARARADRASDGTMQLPTPWTKLRAGDMLWVQEETASCHDRRDPSLTKHFYKADLPGGHIPVPGGAKGARYQTVSVDASKLPRDQSRYTLAVEAVRIFRARDITWDEIRAEGGFNAHQAMGAWWQYRYGFTLGTWDDNPEVCGIKFRFVDGNIDAGWKYTPEPPPTNPNSARTAATITAMGERWARGEE